MNEPQKKVFTCDYTDCNRHYSTFGNLKTHLKTHRGEFAYVCNEKECKKHFLTSYALRIHTRTHTNEKPYECTQCNKRFNTVYRLNSHFRMHNGELFDCQSCHKQFIYRSDLKKHSRIHSGEKPYKCSIQFCNKSFKASHHLRYHVLTHNNKPFKCSAYSCNKIFKTDSSLTNHMRSEHKFKILKQLNNTNQMQSVRIEATYDKETIGSFELNGNLNNQIEAVSLDLNCLSESTNLMSPLYTFDSTKGLLTVMNENKMNINEIEPVSTNALNAQNLYDLLVRLQQNDQLKLDTDSQQITSQFYLNSKQLDSLLNNLDESNINEENRSDNNLSIPNELTDLEDINISSLPQFNTNPFECQELCCLLKFVALDEFN